MFEYLNIWDCPFVEVIRTETAEGSFYCYRCNNPVNRSDYCAEYNGDGACPSRAKINEHRD